MDENAENGTANDAVPAEIDAAEFAAWVAEARAGARCVYFRGAITIDPGGQAMKEAAWTAYLAGDVELAQRPRAAGGWDYIARRRRRSFSGQDARHMPRRPG